MVLGLTGMVLNVLRIVLDMTGMLSNQRHLQFDRPHAGAAAWDLLGAAGGRTWEGRPEHTVQCTRIQYSELVYGTVHLSTVQYSAVFVFGSGPPSSPGAPRCAHLHCSN